MKVLVAEDDSHTRKGLIDILSGEGYHVVAACDGQEALELFAAEKPDFLCLDIMMPGKSGYDVCREVRRQNANVPIIFISAKSEEIDTVLGLELGADDFITKPFGIQSVLARVRAVTRRTFANQAAGDGAGAAADFFMDDLRVAPDELRAYRGDETIELSLRDVKILVLLHRNKGKAVDRDTIFDECWGLNYLPNSRSLDQHVSQLRKRVEKDHRSPQIIRTVHGVGYRFEG
jgi:DNA-binding response OmpR family regulator